MKKKILIISLIFFMQALFGYSLAYNIIDSTDNLGISQTDKKEIFNVVNDYLQNFNSSNLEGVKKNISRDYSEESNDADGKQIKQGYNEFIKKIEGDFVKLSSVTNIICNNLEITDLVMDKNKVVFVLYIESQGTQKKDKKVITHSEIVQVQMVKKDGTWKIISYRYVH